VTASHVKVLARSFFPRARVSILLNQSVKQAGTVSWKEPAENWNIAEIKQKLEAASGFEPLHRGFADLSLNHLGTPPYFDS
jgi:hypothetical protein